MPGKQDDPVKISRTGRRVDRGIEDKEILGDNSKSHQEHQAGCNEKKRSQAYHDKAVLLVIGIWTGSIGHAVLEAEFDFAVWIEHLEENPVYQFVNDDEHRVNHEKENERDQKAGQITHADTIAEITGSKKYIGKRSE